MTRQPYIWLHPGGHGPACDWARLAYESFTKGNYADADRQLHRALSLDPHCWWSVGDAAIVHAAAGSFNEAALAAELSLLLTPKGHKVYPILLANAALVMVEAKRFDEAVEYAKEAMALSADDRVAYACGRVFATVGRVEDAVQLYRRVTAANPKHNPASQDVCFAQTLTDCDPRELLETRRSYANAHRVVRPTKPHHQVSLNGKPIRVGYVSGDFKRHSAAMIFGGVVLKHSPRVEVYLYSTAMTAPATDEYTRRFMAAAGADPSNPGDASVGRWRDISRASDDDAEALIRKDKIDILVDLSGHTGGNRLPLFLRKPAPVQVTAWGFAHGTGYEEIDYFLADKTAVPEDERQFYAERVVDLPCVVTYLPPDWLDLPGESPPPFKGNGFFTFGCFCRFEKVSDAYLECVRRILDSVPNSRILFKDEAYHIPYHCRLVMDALRVDPSRLLFVRGTEQPDHLRAYQRCDLVLDPFPHSGGVTALEQLWMGVPLITRYGRQAAGRTAASVLACMNRSNRLVAHDGEDYVARAAALATSMSGFVGEIRKTLRQELLDSPVVKGYVGAVEDAYAEMLRRRVPA